MPPRKPNVKSDLYPYHITARCINRDWFQIPIHIVWSIMEDYLWFIEYSYNVRIHAFVLMQNHFHLLLSTPEANVSEAMNYFMRETSRAITRSSNRINQTYGSRFFRCLLTSHNYYLNVYKYVYRNPVKAGIVAKVEDYKYSTLRGLLGWEHLYIPVYFDSTLLNSVEDTLRWLNQPPLDEDDLAIKYALSRNIFALAKDPLNKRPHRLESELY